MHIDISTGDANRGDLQIQSSVPKPARGNQVGRRGQTAQSRRVRRRNNPCSDDECALHDGSIPEFRKDS